MLVKSITSFALTVPFNVAFRHASAERATTRTLWAEVTGVDGTTGYGEGCPREYVTGESLHSANLFVSAYASDWLASIHDVDTLVEWAARHRREIDANPAAWTAIELALLDLLGKMESRSVDALLGLPELAGRFRYTAVLGDASPPQFEKQLEDYLRAGFREFKIKLSGDATRDLAKVRMLGAAGIAPGSVRADANNLWNDAGTAIGKLSALNFPFFALEEPLPAGDYAGMSRMASVLNTNIILDESLLRIDQLDQLGAAPDRWIVNVRISKMGGLLRSLEVTHVAQQRGLRVIIGAHVGETSLLTRAALTVANGARDILVAQEGAFGTHLLACDVVDPPIMFGPGGILDSAELKGKGAPGLGLVIMRPVSHLRAL